MNGTVFLIYTILWVSLSIITMNPGIMGVGAMGWFAVFFWTMNRDAKKLGINKNQGKKKK